MALKKNPYDTVVYLVLAELSLLSICDYSSQSAVGAVYGKVHPRGEHQPPLETLRRFGGAR